MSRDITVPLGAKYRYRAWRTPGSSAEKLRVESVRLPANMQIVTTLREIKMATAFVLDEAQFVDFYPDRSSLV